VEISKRVDKQFECQTAESGTRIVCFGIMDKIVVRRKEGGIYSPRCFESAMGACPSRSHFLILRAALSGREKNGAELRKFALQ
jgi:hypothetical protein